INTVHQECGRTTTLRSSDIVRSKSEPGGYGKERRWRRWLWTTRNLDQTPIPGVDRCAFTSKQDQYI
ncbi:unnamed protein product, partial [Musa banksii]